MRKNKTTKQVGLEKNTFQDVTSSLQDIIIFQDADGSYQLFNKYIITKIDQFEYRVTSTSTALDLKFAYLKNATTWCIFDKRERFLDANKINELDSKLNGVDIDMQVHQRLFKRSPTSEGQLIYVAKMTEDRLKKSRIISELASYAADSKRWQTKRYEKR